MSEQDALSSSGDGVDLVVAARASVRAAAAAVAGLADHLDSLPEVVDLVLNIPGKVIVTGVGTSGATARRMAHLLSVSGTPALFLHPGDAMHGSVGAVGPGDLLVALSKGGDSDEVNTTAARARQRGATVLAMTTRPDSPLGRLADRVVALPPAGDEDPQGVIAMGSTLVAAAYGDALAMALMARRGYPWSEVLASHPGGAVGKAAERERT